MEVTTINPKDKVKIQLYLIVDRKKAVRLTKTPPTVTGKRLSTVIKTLDTRKFAWNKIRRIGIFDFRAFLNLAIDVTSETVANSLGIDVDAVKDGLTDIYNNREKE